MPRNVEHTLQAVLRDRAKLQTILNRVSLDRTRPPERNAEIAGHIQQILQLLGQDDLRQFETRTIARDARSAALEIAADKAERKAERKGRREPKPRRRKTEGKRRARSAGSAGSVRTKAAAAARTAKRRS